jgi:glutaredoxin 2
LNLGLLSENNWINSVWQNHYLHKKKYKKKNNIKITSSYHNSLWMRLMIFQDLEEFKIKKIIKIFKKRKKTSSQYFINQISSTFGP